MDIRSILNFKFDFHSFQRSVPEFKDSFGINAKKLLEEIINNFKNFQPIEIAETDKIVTHRKFMNIAPGGMNSLSISFSKREIRALAFCLDYKEKEQPYNIKIIQTRYLNYAIKLLSDNYSNLMLIPLIDCHLNSWPYPNELLIDFLKKRFEIYRGNRPELISIKKNAEFILNSRGAIILSAKFFGEKIKPSDVWNYLGLREHTRSFKYFDSFILPYTDNLLRTTYTPDKIGEIIDFLKVHNNEETDKKVLARIIIKLGSSASLEFKDRIKSYVLKRIGDPVFNIHEWQASWEGATEREKEQLNKARGIFTQWYVEENIEMFFDKLSRQIDPEGFKYRKAFWLAYARHIENFKIIGSKRIKRLLQYDPKTEQLLERRFAILSNIPDESDESAFLFRIKNYVFVEFGKTGNALYVYKNSNPDAPGFDRRSYTIYQLKHLKINQQLFDKWDNGEGRVIHLGSEYYRWQDKLSTWLRRTLGINNIRGYYI